MENEISPLKKYRRQPKIYANLPSGGRYYNDNIVANQAYAEMPVFSMTANDEILFKTPDALINGQATAQNIRSCIPGILDPMQLVTLDIDYILLAIRMASYGPNLTVNAPCSHCKEENQYDIEIQGLLDYFSNLIYEDQIVINGFTFTLRPLTYKQYTEFQQQNIALARAIQIQAVKMEEEDRKKFTNDTLLQIATIGVQAVLQMIYSITVDGVEETNKQEIKEFLDDNDISMFNKIKQHVESQVANWRIPNQQVMCEHCSKENSVAVRVDQTDFFVKG